MKSNYHILQVLETAEARLRKSIILRTRELYKGLCLERSERLYRFMGFQLVGAAKTKKAALPKARLSVRQK